MLEKLHLKLLYRLPLCQLLVIHKLITLLEFLRRRLNNLRCHRPYRILVSQN